MGIKTAYSELAIFGNPPAFTEPLHVGRPNIGDRERLLQRINDMLDRRWLSNHGPFVQEFEAEVARRLGVKHCIAMCNGTVALEIAIRALGLTGEVIYLHSRSLRRPMPCSGRKSRPYSVTSTSAPIPSTRLLWSV